MESKWLKKFGCYSCSNHQDRPQHNISLIHPNGDIEKLCIECEQKLKIKNENSI